MKVQVRVGPAPIATFESDGYLPGVDDIVLVHGVNIQNGRFKVAERGVEITTGANSPDTSSSWVAYVEVQPAR
jgi:hypothetical protein